MKRHDEYSQVQEHYIWLASKTKIKIESKDVCVIQNIAQKVSISFHTHISTLKS